MAVYQNKKGQWVAALRFGGRGGKQVVRRRDPRDDTPIRSEAHAKQVEAWLRLERERQEERIAEGNTPALDEIGDLTLSEIALHAYRNLWTRLPNTINPHLPLDDQRIPSDAYKKHYRSAIRLRLIGNQQTRAADPGFPWLGHLKPREIRRGALHRWKDAMKQRGHGPRAINAAIETGKTLVYYGIARELCPDTNPFSRFPKENETTRDPVFVTDEQLDALLAGMPTEQDRTILAVLDGLGMRISEAMTIKRSQLQLEGKHIRVWRSKSNRWENIPLIPSLRRQLEAHLATAPPSEWLFPAPKKPSTHVDVHNWRSRVFRRSVRNTAWMLAAEGKPVTFDWDKLIPRDFRNRLVSRINAHPDGSLEIAGEIVGHTHKWMSMRYSRPLNEKRDAVLRSLAGDE